MTQANAKPLTFEAYLEYDDGSDIRYDLLSNGALIEVPNESVLNDYLARFLMLQLSAVVDLRLIIAHSLTMEVEPVGDNYRNRRPDLVVLRPEHLELDSIIRRTALPLGSPAPQMVVEIVSAGSESDDNTRRDYEWKRQQYESWGIPEYWIIDPERAKVTVLVLVDGVYQESVYTGDQWVLSTVFPELRLKASSLLTA
jgi:Uma2 family endonuclease